MIFQTEINVFGTSDFFPGIRAKWNLSIKGTKISANYQLRQEDYKKKQQKNKD